LSATSHQNPQKIAIVILRFCLCFNPRFGTTPLPTLKTFTSKLEYLLKYPASSFHPAGFIFINFRLLIINLSVNFLSLLFSGSFRSLDLFKKISEQKKIARIITFYNQTKKN